MKCSCSLSFIFCAGVLLLYGCKPKLNLSEHEVESIAIKQAEPGGTLRPSDVRKLQQVIEQDPISVVAGTAAEPPLSQIAPQPVDINELGYNRSQFLITNRWSTFRYLGPTPAGAGLLGQSLNAAQIKALGTPFDTVPVVTAAVTVQQMMDGYFVPLLNSFPDFARLLKQIFVQGVYYSPHYSLPDGSKPPRDNAEVKGLMSMYFYPSSCFDQSSMSCSNVWSAGHDPTVIGHELGHVIFNTIRGSKNIFGFQWNAANEGYADYFSAVYFKDPMVGRIWRAAPGGTSLLRCVSALALNADPESATSTHKFSVNWSTLLWRIQSRLVSELKMTRLDVDRIVLQSIVYLGETEKLKLGDAAAALLKAAVTLNYTATQEIINQEIAKSQIDMEDVQTVGLQSRGPDLDPDGLQHKKAQCGNISYAVQTGGKVVRWSNFILLCLPLFIGLIFYFLNKMIKHFIDFLGKY